MTADEVGAELEIRNLVAAIARLADAGDPDEYLACFTEDAVWEMPANPAVGVPASVRTGRRELEAGVLERRAAGVQGPGTATRHVISTISVSLDGADRARGQAYWLLLGDTATTPVLRSMGTYDDVFRRVAGNWRLAHRVITIG